MSTDTPETEAGRKPNGIYCDYVHWTTCARIERHRDALLAALKGRVVVVEAADSDLRDLLDHLKAQGRVELVDVVRRIRANLAFGHDTAHAAIAAAEPKAEGKG